MLYLRFLSYQTGFILYTYINIKRIHSIKLFAECVTFHKNSCKHCEWLVDLNSDCTELIMQIWLICVIV